MHFLYRRWRTKICVLLMQFAYTIFFCSVIPFTHQRSAKPSSNQMHVRNTYSNIYILTSQNFQCIFELINNFPLKKKDSLSLSHFSSNNKMFARQQKCTHTQMHNLIPVLHLSSASTIFEMRTSHMCISIYNSAVGKQNALRRRQFQQSRIFDGRLCTTHA